MLSHAHIVAISGRETTCKQCALRNDCLVQTEAGCPTAELQLPTVPRVMHRGDHLFRTGERFHSIFVLRSGAIKTYVVLPGGEEQVIGFHTPGDIVALDAIDSGCYVSNAMILDTSCVCPLAYEQVQRLCGRSPELHRRLLRRMSRRIVDHEDLLLILGQKTAEQRVAAFLLHYSRKQRKLGISDVDINLSMSRADIASYLALAVETVSRVLTRLQDAGLLNVQRSRVHITDLERLTGVAEENMEDSAPARRGAGAMH